MVTVSTVILSVFICGIAVDCYVGIVHAAKFFVFDMNDEPKFSNVISQSLTLIPILAIIKT